MKTTMVSTLLLHILGYVMYCSAAPQSTTPVQTFRLRVWNYPQLPVRYNGYAELYLGQVSFGITPNYGGFDAYLDPTNPGTLRESASGLYGALFETDTPGQYSFEFISDPTTPGARTDGFVFHRQGCGNCGGLYLDYRESSDDLSPATFMLIPNTGPALSGSWKIYYNNYTLSTTLPPGSQMISLLQ